jgi:hypothetical protein
MKKQVLLFAAAGLFAAGASAQLYTPQGGIQGQTSNNTVGIGAGSAPTPDGSLHIQTSFKNLLYLKCIQEPMVGQGGAIAFPQRAIRVDDFTGMNPQGEVFGVAPDGDTRIGIFSFNPPTNLSVRTHFGVYNNEDRRIKLNVSSTKAQLLWNHNSSSAHLEFKHETTGEIPLRLTADGKVGVNTDNFLGNHSLYVDGTMIGEELFIKDSGNWPDYVFSPSHKRLSLYDLDTYINTHKRLPGMPSADEVAETGIEMGETVRLLTEKMEEFTLYLIELKQENDALKAEIETLKAGN